MTLGAKLKELREQHGLLLRQVAAAIEVGEGFISKIEHDEKPINKGHLQRFAQLYKVAEEELLPYWLAQKVRKTIQDEMFGKKALEIVLKDLH